MPVEQVREGDTQPIYIREQQRNDPSGDSNENSKKVIGLKGHSQLMHMRVTYHFLADLYPIRHAWNRKCEVYPVYSKQTL